MSKQLKLQCENCGKEYIVSSKYLGRKEKCRKCGELILISRANSIDLDSDGTFTTASKVAADNPLINVVKKDDVAIVSIGTSRILDQSNVEQLHQGLKSVVTEEGLTKLVLNLMGVQNMSSSVMGKLVELHKLVKSKGGSLKFCNIDPNVYEIFQIMRFDELFDIYDDEDQAISDFQL